MKMTVRPDFFCFSFLTLFFFIGNMKNTGGNLPAVPLETHPARNAQPTVFHADPCRSRNTTFLSGETLTYKVFYNWNFVWLSAGEVTFRVIDEDDQYRYQVTGETYESYDWFFKVRDYFDTWVQKETLLPIMSTKSLLEGKYRLYDYVTYDQFRLKCYNERGKSKTDIRERKHYELGKCMHDMVSILYYVRNADFKYFKTGDSFPVTIFADKKIWPLSVAYGGREAGKKIKDLGTFNTLKFSPQVIEGDLFPENTEMNIWVTDDANRVPLVIESPLSVGSVKAVLHTHRGLRYPLTAKTGE